MLQWWTLWHMCCFPPCQPVAIYFINHAVSPNLAVMSRYIFSWFWDWNFPHKGPFPQDLNMYQIDLEYILGQERKDYPWVERRNWETDSDGRRGYCKLTTTLSYDIACFQFIVTIMNSFIFNMCNIKLSSFLGNVC